MARRLRHGGDSRTLDQLRADLYADLLLGHDPGVAAPAPAAMVYLHMPVTTALTIERTPSLCPIDRMWVRTVE